MSDCRRALIFGMLSTLFPEQLPDVRSWANFVWFAVAAWVLKDLITTRTDANGDLMTREPSWGAMIPVKWR